MKRRDLERHLREHGARELREGSRRSWWGFDAERSTAIPRHRELAWPLARAICKHARHPTPDRTALNPATSAAGGTLRTPMLTTRARRLLVLLAALTALVLAGCAGIAAASAIHGLGAQNRVRAFTPAAELLAAGQASGSACSRPGSSLSGPEIVAGFCVAAEEGLAPIAGGSQLEDLRASGAQADRGGLTAAGRALEKHQGEGAFPAATGNVAANALGQQQLEEILSDPATRVEQVMSSNFAGGTRYIGPDGRAATFDSSGQFGYFGAY